MEYLASLAIDAHQGNVLVLPSNRRDFNDTVLDFPIIRGFCGPALAFGVDPCADDCSIWFCEERHSVCY